MVHWRCKYLGGILEDWTSTSLHPHLIDWTNWATISLRIKPIFCYQIERAISNYIDFYILLFGWCFGLAQETWANCDLGRIYTFNSIPSKAKKKKKKPVGFELFSLSLSLFGVCAYFFLLVIFLLSFIDKKNWCRKFLNILNIYICFERNKKKIFVFYILFSNDVRNSFDSIILFCLEIVLHKKKLPWLWNFSGS